jgi:hypothetical protein
MLETREVESVEIIWNWKSTTKSWKMLHDVMLTNPHSHNTYYVGNQIKEKVMKHEWKRSRNLYNILVANFE